MWDNPKISINEFLHAQHEYTRPARVRIFSEDSILVNQKFVGKSSFSDSEKNLKLQIDGTVFTIGSW